jgi:hypothetical protein
MCLWFDTNVHQCQLCNEMVLATQVKEHILTNSHRGILMYEHGTDNNDAGLKIMFHTMSYENPAHMQMVRKDTQVSRKLDLN